MSDLTEEIQVLHIPLDKIDLTDTRYQISKKAGDITGLAQSIRETGLTRLPLVWSQREPKESGESSESYILVSGFKRIKALVHNGYKDKVACQIFPGASEADCAVRAVSDTAFSRPLTPAELIQSIQLLGRSMDAADIAKKSLSIFNTQFNAKYIKDLEQIGTLPRKAHELMDDGRLSIKSAKKIASTPPELANCFVNLFSAVKTSASKQVEIIANFLEIAAREKITPQSLYQEKQIQEILTFDNKDLGHKGNLLRRYLVERRFPSLEKKRQDIQKKINSLKLGPGIKFVVPDNFESMIYSCSFEFKTSAEYAARVACLDRVSTDPILEEILKR
jgi:ParB family chromosome partitioning protein